MNAEVGFIHIPNWGEFQHYKQRSVRWIKDYTEQLDRDEYLRLTFHQRGLLDGLRLMYARQNADSSATTLRGISDSTVTLTRRLGQRVLTRDLEALNHAGLIHRSASTTLANGYHVASLEVEREVEREKNVLSRSTAASYEPKPPPWLPGVIPPDGWDDR